MSELVRGASVQARVIYAIALRESRTRFGQHQLGYRAAVGDRGVRPLPASGADGMSRIAHY